MHADMRGFQSHSLPLYATWSTSMGLTFSSILDTLSGLTRWTKEKDVRILMLGLDSAGKVRTTDHLWDELGNGG